MKDNKLNEFRFFISEDMNNTMIEMLLVKQMLEEFPHTLKEKKLLKKHLDEMKEEFVQSFHQFNKSKLEELKEIINQ